jgi:hypothetical protein
MEVHEFTRIFKPILYTILKNWLIMVSITVGTKETIRNAHGCVNYSLSPKSLTRLCSHPDETRAGRTLRGAHTDKAGAGR